jgi:hypothetical protein
VAISRVNIGGNIIGITNLEDIFKDVESARIENIDNLKSLIIKKVKLKDYIPSSAESIYKEDLYEEYLVFTGKLRARKREKSSIEVRLYGSSCYNCERFDAMIKDILTRAGLLVDYQHITDLRELSRAGIISTPALAVNDKVILTGQVPAENRLETILLQAIEKAKTAEEA